MFFSIPHYFKVLSTGDSTRAPLGNLRPADLQIISFNPANAPSINTYIMGEITDRSNMYAQFMVEGFSTGGALAGISMITLTSSGTFLPTVT